MEIATMGKVLVAARIENMADLWEVRQGRKD